MAWDSLNPELPALFASLSALVLLNFIVSLTVCPELFLSPTPCTTTFFAVIGG